MSDWTTQIERSIDVNNPPYDDDKMFYNYSAHRYILLPLAFQQETGLDLSLRVNDALGEKSNILNFYFNYNISAPVYDYIKSAKQDVRLIEYICAKSPTAREVIYQAMILQGAYFATNGDPSQFSGINLKNGYVMDRDSLILHTLSPRAQLLIAETEIPEYGGNTLAYSGFIAPLHHIPDYAEGRY